MTANGDKSRRLSGTHITIIVLGLALVLAPTAVYAAERVVSVIGDPFNSSVYARLSEDGRLGVRGEATSQQGVPSNEWHRQSLVMQEVPFGGPAAMTPLLKGAPPGHGIGISQLIAAYAAAASSERSPELVLVTRHVEGVCPEAGGKYRPGVDEVLFRFATPSGSGANQYEQLVFPVPLTVQPSPTHSTCLYAAAARGGFEVTANGVSGPATPRFIPAKGAVTQAPSDK